MNFLFFILSLTAVANPDPQAVEAKVQADLENALVRMLPAEQFHVQVNTDVGMSVERKVVEGETVVANPDPPEITVSPMPGFVPEAEIKPPRAPLQTRQVYRMVETPYLKNVRVAVKFDDIVPPMTVLKGKALVSEYLRNNYPRNGLASFGVIKMFKKDPPKPPEEPKEIKPEEPPLLEPWQWGVVGVLVLLALYLLKKVFEPAPRSRTKTPNPALNPAFAGGPYGMPWQSVGNMMAQAGFQPQEIDEKIQAMNLRKKLLEKFLSRSEAFRQYFGVISNVDKEEIYACLRGPAFDNFLEGIGIDKPKAHEGDPNDLMDILEVHLKSFEEFVQSKDWNDKQFFGFLHTLTDQQLLTLATHENPATVGLMLRFLKANQSAKVLEALPPAQRREVLVHTNQAPNTSFSDLMAIERDVRSTIQKMPSNLYTSKKQEIEFWGNVLSESQNQDSILEDLEKTNPEIYVSLKKFKFTLEDAATLTNTLIEEVMSAVDNEELCLALTTCSEDVMEVLLEGISLKRRKILVNQMRSYRNAPQPDKTKARNQLTKRFREVMQ